jgi:hypothetical protein
MDHRRTRAEAAGAGEQLDRPEAVFVLTLLDLAGLLVCVHMEDKSLSIGMAGDLFEPVGRAGAHGVGGKADGDTRFP